MAQSTAGFVRLCHASGFFAAALLLSALAACPGSGPLPERKIRDGLGRTVAVRKSPRRVISLAPSVTDTLLALGFGDRLVGVCDFCRLPAGGPRPARVGGMVGPSLEAIRALRPDLLIASTSGNDPSLAPQADALGVPLYTVDTPDVDRTLASIEDLSDLLGDPQRGRRLVGDLHLRLDAVRARVGGRRPPRVLFLVWGEPLVVPGRPAFLTDALRRAGADSVSASAPAAWPSFDLESVLALAPEAILTTTKNAAIAERLPRDPAWASVPAVRSGRILVVTEAIEQPGPEVVRGIEEVARLLHPDAFGNGGSGKERPPPSGRI